MAFNEAQKTAISHGEGPCMVLAGPGSGKTTVLTHRIRHLIQEHQVPGEQILVITFTKAAAEEMKNRFSQLMDGSTEGVTFGTFHSVFFGILKYRYQLHKGSILYEGEKLKILEEILYKNFPNIEYDRELMEGILKEISKVKNLGGWTEDYKSGEDRIPFEKVYAQYRKVLRERHLLDFDDMLLLTDQLFQREKEILGFFREKYRYIMVDEFQDANALQYSVVKQLAFPRNNLFIVGDDDQSIYGFRGAEPGIMLSFQKEFPETKQVFLNINYRSYKSIVHKSVKVIQKNKNRFSKKLRANHTERGQVICSVFKDREEEGAFLAEEVKRILSEKQELHRTAVLSRTNGGFNSVISAFVRNEIPFYFTEKMKNPYDQGIVQPIYAILNYQMGDHSRKNFLRFMNCPVRYFARKDLVKDPVELGELEKYYKEKNERPWMADKVKELSYHFSVLDRIKNPFGMINYIRKGMGYDRYVSEFAENRGVKKDPLFETLEEIQESAKSYNSTKKWYAFIKRYEEVLKEAFIKDQQAQGGKVQLMTLHGAKGLEYDNVYIIDCNEKMIPHEKAVQEKEIEEERRLFYVGMTRAIKKLHLCSTMFSGGKKMELSRFLKDL